MEKVKILVLCTGNSCRSQMAEAYLKHFAAGKAVIYSAGVETHGLNPQAMLVLQEDGLQTTELYSKHVDDLKNIPFDYLISVCDRAKESCPLYFTTAKQIHQSFRDPSKYNGNEEDKMKLFYEVRNEIKQFCKAFVESLSL